MSIYDHYNDLLLLYPLESSKNLQGFKTSFLDIRQYLQIKLYGYFIRSILFKILLKILYITALILSVKNYS
jgi:hypothetical protein